MSRDAAVRRDDPVWVFIHIPKTAGTTLHQVFLRQARRRSVVTLRVLDEPPEAVGAHLEQAGGDAIDVVQGHVYYGVHRHLSRPVRYVTMLRHPVDRIWSLYRYVRTEPQHPLHEQVRGMSLDRFVESGIDRDQVDDGQVRQLVGAHGRAVTDADLATAIERLDSDFSAVGLQEEFDASLVLFRRTLGWRLPPVYLSRNVTRRREPLDDAARRLIEAHNALDLALHQHAATLLEARRAELPGFEAELAGLRALNRLVRVVARWHR